MWIEVFKTGVQKDSKGREINFNPEDLDLIAQNYNESIISDPSKEAPLVKGHPKDDAPALAWVETLARRKDKLLAKLKNLSSETAKELKEKKFNKVSISLYPNKNLRHIGLLGAVQPAVKGLEPISFSQYSLDLKEKEDIEKKYRIKEFKDFAEKLIADGNSFITPSDRESVIDFMELASQKDKELKDEVYLPAFKNLITKKVESNLFNNYSTSIDLIEDEFITENSNPERLDLHKKAIKYRNENPGTSYEEALLKIQ